MSRKPVKARSLLEQLGVLTNQAGIGADQRHKRGAFLLLIGALALLFLLSIGITGLPLLPGEPFGLPVAPAGRPGINSNLPGGEIIVLFVRVLLALSLLLFPINLIMAILTKEGRRRLLTNLVSIAVLWFLLNALTRVARNLAQQQTDTAASQPPSGVLPPLPPVPEFTANPPDWTVFAVTLAVSLLLVGLAAGALWLIWRQRRQSTPLVRLGEEAQAAIESLQAGGDLKSIVIRCYQEMSRVLHQGRGIQRGIAMTPSEFEQALQGKGLPRDAVHQLTRLFEDVRYGAKQAGEQEERLAIDSLSAIVAACRRTGSA